jgi:hypothetical protein
MRNLSPKYFATPTNRLTISRGPSNCCNNFADSRCYSEQAKQWGLFYSLQDFDVRARLR